MKKFLSWVFALASLVLLVVFVIFLGLYIKGRIAGLSGEKQYENYLLIFAFSLIWSMICGFAGHFLAKGKGFPHYVTFPMYFVIFGVFFIIGGIKALFCKILGLSASSLSSSSSKTENSTPVYYLTDDYGCKRKLTLSESHCQDYQTPLDSGFGANYSRYKDDIGNYWRTYDGNKTFVSETSLKKQGWRI